MKTLLFPRLAATLAALLFAAAAQASLVGHQITGSLVLNNNGQNAFDPALGFAPADTLNMDGTTVTVSASAIEFGAAQAEDGISVRIIADFTADGLRVEFVTTGVGSATFFPWDVRFSSLDVGLFQGISLISDSFDPGMNFSIVGDEIRLTWAGGARQGDVNFSAVFAIQSPDDMQVPEPGSLALAGIALAGLGLARRRQIRP